MSSLRSSLVVALVLLVAGCNAASVAITSSWDGGYCANLVVTNSGSSTVTGFTVSLVLSSGTVSSGWSATFAQVDATHWTVTPPNWGISIAPGASYTAGFCGTYSGSLVAPTFTVTFPGGSATTTTAAPATTTTTKAPTTTAAPGTTTTTTAAPGGTTTTKAPTTTTAAPVAGTCGNGNVGNKICPDPTMCCSMYGWCDTTAAHCGASVCVGGPCIGSTTTTAAPATTTTAAPGTTTTAAPGTTTTAAPGTTTTTKAPTTTTTTTTKAPTTTTAAPVAGTCGNGNLGNKICADPTLCCSMYGWCDNTATHCTPPTCVGGPCIGGTTTTSAPSGSTTASPTSGPTSSPGVCPAGKNCATDPATCGACTMETRSACVNPNHVALTFDDGPLSPMTDEVLAILASNNVKATFFVLGVQIESEGPSKVLAAFNAGHQIASHGYDHLGPDNGGGLLLDDRSDAALATEIGSNQNIIKGVIGVKPQYFRAPFLGCTTARCLSIVQSYGLQHSSRNLDTNDWQLLPTDPNPSQSLLTNIADYLAIAPIPSTDGAVVLMHDIHQTSVDGLQTVINYFKNQGKKFVRLDECFGYQPLAYQM